MRALVKLVTFFWFLGACTLANAQSGEEKITLNFVNADIESVVKAVGQITGKNFVIDPRVKGTVNIISSNPVSRDLVYQILLSALRLQGFAAIESQGFVKIVPEADAKQNASPTVGKNTRLSGDRIITQIYPLQYESAAQLLPVLRPLVSPNNMIAAYPNNNTLVITDYADNVRRIVKIIEAIDLPNNSEIIAIKLRHASAVDLAQILTRLIPDAATPTAAGAAPAPSSRLFVAADVRTNSLLVRSDSPALIIRVRSLIASLDAPGAAAAGIQVVYLRNADATKIAEILRAILAGEVKNSVVPTTVPGAGTIAAPAAAHLAALPPAAPGSGFVQADAATNSLIIAAPEGVYNSLRAVIDQLDTRRAQVYIEALIAEVSSDKAAEFGFQFQNLSGLNSNDRRVIGGTNFGGSGRNIIDTAAALGTIGEGLNIGVIRGRVTIPGIGEVLNLGVLARALESDADANILSTPNLLTMDNEEAKIVVGQNVPLITGSYAQAVGGGLTGAAVNPFQTIERRDVGLTLRVKPQVTEGGTVKLKIFQEVSNVQSDSSAGLITNKRSIDSTVLVEDGQIVVLGGLIQDDVKNDTDKVPLLGDIPLIGNLFKYESRRRTKTNLMVFLRPFVLREPTASVSFTGDRYDYIRNQQKNAQPEPHWFLPSLPAPALPELQSLERSQRPPVTPPMVPAPTAP